MSWHTGGGSGPSGQPAPGHVGEESSPKRGTASGRGNLHLTLDDGRKNVFPLDGQIWAGKFLEVLWVEAGECRVWGGERNLQSRPFLQGTDLVHLEINVGNPTHPGLAFSSVGHTPMSGSHLIGTLMANLPLPGDIQQHTTFEMEPSSKSEISNSHQYFPCVCQICL